MTSNMKYFRHETAAKELTVYPFVCWHRGAENSNEEFIHEMIDQVKSDPNGKWIYMGDGGEVATKNSKGDVYSQLMSPQEQLNDLVKLLKPIRDKGLFLIKGNHGNRTYKESGLSFDESLGLALQLPYLGTSAFWRLVVNRSRYSIYTHHGSDSGATIASKVNAAKKAEAYITADAIITAHSHVAMELPVRASASVDEGTGSGRRKDPIVWTYTHNYIAGAAYDSRRGGYGEEKLYSPILPVHMGITFSGETERIDGKGPFPVKRQTMKLFRAK